MPATLERVYLNEAPTPCESCGHDIKWNYVVRLENGARQTVGSECVKPLCGETADAQRLSKRVRAAERQWKAGSPAPREGESRAEYVNRRLEEMANARHGWDEYRRVLRGGLLHLFAESDLQRRGERKPGRDFHYDDRSFGCDARERGACTRCQGQDRQWEAWQARIKAEMESILRGVEERTSSNRFDWHGVPAYKLP